VESGRREADPDGETDITIDVPSGRVLARVACSGGRPVAVAFRNVPSYVLARGIDVTVGGCTVAVDVAYGGAIYAMASAASLDLRVTQEQLPALVAAGRAIKAALEGSAAARHPSDERLSGIYGTILYEQGGPEAGSGGADRAVVRQRNVAVFADGEVDRSPCGSGTSARAALLHAEGRLALDAAFVHESIVGTEFDARVTEELESEGRASVITEISGAAFRTGEHRFVLDPRDPLGTGFVLR
jgi:proline racemase